ncbi:MAG: hypothetical protein ACK46X_19245, partial [Candidatus Sericytochromatia bacterium]
MFKKTFMALGVAGVMALGTAAPALAGEQDFTLVNKTGLIFTEVYVEPTSNEEDWGDEVMGEDRVLAANEEVDIEFEGSEECLYDIKLVDEKGTAWVVGGLDLCKIHSFTLTKKG